MDHLTKEERSKLMSKIRGKHTKPEMYVRRIIWHQGFRYRLHVRKLPGSPDVVITRLKKAIFINGCFWHGHSCRSSIPKTNTGFWKEKIERNKRRDVSNIRKLRREGWSCLVIWECELSKTTTVKKLLRFLES